jgi:cytochrome P450
MVAGSDTTSSVIANVLYFLTSHPATYKRLQAEVDGLGDKLTDCSAQAQLPYLNGVMCVVSENPNCLYAYRCVF